MSELIPDDPNKTALERLIIILKNKYNAFEDEKPYRGVKGQMAWLLIQAFKFQTEDLKRGPEDGQWKCPECGKRMRVVSEEQIENIKKGEDLDHLKYRDAPKIGKVKDIQKGMD